MKLIVKKEGRPGIYIPEKESLIKFIKERKLDYIHNFIPNGNMIIGADHLEKEVLQDIRDGERLAVFTDSKANLGHSLAIIKNNRLECYDIRKISETDLEIV